MLYHTNSRVPGEYTAARFQFGLVSVYTHTHSPLVQPAPAT
eukprot:SAG31_NODE_9048_length_1343_cov_1.081190_3_plen_40_part_01